MGPARLDRGELIRRLSPRVPAVLVDELLDAFEPAAQAAIRSAQEIRKKAETPGS